MWYIWPILVIFGMQYHEKTWRSLNDYSLAHLTLVLLLHYFVKCRYGSKNNNFVAFEDNDRDALWQFFLHTSTVDVKTFYVCLIFARFF